MISPKTLFASVLIYYTVGIISITLLFSDLLYPTPDINMGICAVISFIFIVFPCACAMLYWLLTGGLDGSEKVINNNEDNKDERAIS
jgi:hypothetical protein